MKSKQRLVRYTRGMKVPVLSLLTFVLLCFIFHSQIAAQEQVKVKLKSREFTAPAGISTETLSGLHSAIITEQKKPHVMIQLTRIPINIEKEMLKERGLTLLNYLGGNTWYCSISDAEVLSFVDKKYLVKNPVMGLVRWIGRIDPEDKMSAMIKEQRIGSWARRPDGNVSLIISYFKDIDVEYARTRLLALGAEILGSVDAVYNLVVAIQEQKIPDVAAEDFVSWIETVPPPGVPESQRARAHIQADLLQNAPYNLTGDGVIVGVFEWTHVSTTHLDLTGRTTRKDTTGYDPGHHTTMVGGIIGGSGAQSANNYGAAYQWKGMATSSSIYTYNAETGGTADDDYLDYSNDLQDAISTDFIDIANNSWGSENGCHDVVYGSYEGLCSTLDAAVKGDFGRPVTIIFSAGNERAGYGDPVSTDCITNTIAPYANYRTVNYPKAAKNIIAVGAIDSYNNRMSQYSSWGPVGDGRIKPDIVASGQHNGRLSSDISIIDINNIYGDAPYYLNGAGYRTPGTAGGYVYGWFAQTSCAAAATSGSLALLLERYRDVMKTNLNPLPSTMKALLIHSALDLDDATTWYNPGPDYASGYGLLQIKEAVDLVDSYLFREGKISNNRSDEYTFTLPADATSVKVTLVWDDPSAAPNAPEALVNDIDLEVYDPAGTRYYPWTLDPANPSNDAVTTADHLNNVEQVFVYQGLTSGTWRVVIYPYALPEPPQRYSLVADYTLNGKVDVMQVLDRSGSMSGMASSGMQGSKIEKLRDAASEFVTLMLPNVGNRLGLVQFNQDVVPFPAGSGTDLTILDNTKAALLQNTTIPSIVNGGSTSIGDGLKAALDQFLLVNSPNDRSILLVTDGMENTSKWISEVQDDLISNDIAVHALGLGYGSGINESKLVNLAQATHGTYRITSDHLVFQKLFIETLAGSVDWNAINDPIDTITRGAEVRVPVVISADQTDASFTAFWEGIDNAINVVLLSPSGKTVPVLPEGAGIRYKKHPHYVAYQLDFPLEGDLSQEWAGVWTLILTGSDSIPQKDSVRYSTAAFAESGPDLKVSFSTISSLTGDIVELKARLTRAGAPITGVTLEAFGDIPAVGAGNVLHNGKVNWDQLQQSMNINGDSINIIDRKLILLSKAAGQDVLQRTETSLRLYDDGMHGDGMADDGLYANKFTETKIQGSYTFRFVASGIPVGDDRTSTCEWTESFHNEVKIDPSSSDITITAKDSGAAGIAHDVFVSLKDRFGNYMGPGHDVKASIATGGVVTLTDKVDGTYSGEVILTQSQVNSKTPVEIIVDGKKFTEIKPFLYRFSLSMHAGRSDPTGVSTVG